MQVARQVNALTYQEQHGQAEAAEDFEVDPDALKGERHEQVGGPAEHKEGDPRQVQACPHRIRQGQGVAHDAFDQQGVANKVATGKHQGKQPVHHGRFPFEEGLAVERQRQAAEYQAGNQRQPLAFFEFALFEKQNAVHHHRAGDQHGGRAENAAEGQAMAGDLDDAGFDFVDDEKQEQRDEVDELFHSGSQKQDVAA